MNKTACTCRDVVCPVHPSIEDQILMKVKQREHDKSIFGTVPLGPRGLYIEAMADKIENAAKARNEEIAKLKAEIEKLEEYKFRYESCSK